MYIRFQRYTPSGAIQKSLSISITNQGVQALTSEIGRIGIGSTFARSGRLVIS